MIAQHRAFFAALGLTRTLGRVIEQVFCRPDWTVHRFNIRLEGDYLFAFDPDLKTSIEGRLPLVKYALKQRVVAFKGQTGMFQGFDHSNNEHFRVKANETRAEFFDQSANRTFYFYPDGEFALPLVEEAKPTCPG